MDRLFRRAATATIALLALTACSHTSIGNRLSAKPNLNQLKEGDFQALNAGDPGNEVNIYKYAKYGKYTVFDFSSQY